MENIQTIVSAVKEKNGENTIVFVRLDDIYIALDNDAEKVAQILKIEIVEAKSEELKGKKFCQVPAVWIANNAVRDLCGAGCRVALVDALLPEHVSKNTVTRKIK